MSAEWVRNEQRVIARTGLGDVYAEGVVRAYCDAPTVLIITDSGARVNWRADLCEPTEGSK